MGGFSIFHWIIVLAIIGVPLVLVLVFSRRSNNTPMTIHRDGSSLSASETTPTNWQQTFFSFNGRIGRGKWWVSNLIVWAPMIVALILLDIVMLTNTSEENSEEPTWFVVFSLVWYVLVVWTSICLNAKRWHDRDKSGWMQLIGLIPLVGIWALIENGFLKGTEGPNRFGQDPLNLQ
jgi:uncharacterized membrane protein YhaH (DUF805 family)